MGTLEVLSKQLCSLAVLLSWPLLNQGCFFISPTHGIVYAAVFLLYDAVFGGQDCVLFVMSLYLFWNLHKNLLHATLRAMRHIERPINTCCLIRRRKI